MTRSAKDTRVQREAAFWFSLIETDAPSEADSTRFRQWLAENPANAEAYEALAAIWRDSGKLTHLADLERPHSFRKERRRRGPLPAWGAHIKAPAAALAGLVLVGLVLMTLLEWPFGGGAQRVHVTDIGEIHELTLADGSAVTLGPKSRLEVAFTQAERRVALSAGEAFFEVARDADRPFVVAADGTTIRALGTRFNVHEGPRGLTVAVAEGTVEVARTAPAGRPEGTEAAAEERRRLSAGEKVVAFAEGGLAPVERIAPELPGAWRQGRLVYENATLAEVVADANRYSRTPIEIGAPALAELRVFATFRASDIDRLIADLEQSLPVVADRTPAGRIVLRPAPKTTG